MAEIDDDKATTTARTSAEETRIVCDSYDMGSDNFEEDNGKTVSFYVPK